MTLKETNVKKPQFEFRFAVITKDEHGEVIYTFKTHKEATQFYEELNKTLVSIG